MKLFCRHKYKKELVKYYTLHGSSLYSYIKLVLHPIVIVTVYSVERCSNCNKIFESEILKKEVIEERLNEYLLAIMQYGVVSKEEYILK